jgi:uncharacterized protein
MNIAGRDDEIGILNSLLETERSEFLAVYGRRRIGKTFLIRQVYEKHIVFDTSGLHEKNIEQQLENFWLDISRASGKNTLLPQTWLQAFSLLKAHLDTKKSRQKKVIFLDEISWFDTPRSGFLAALDNFWNMYCSKRADIVLVICGSAASWIINKVINNRGGLHNRITKQILLRPFDLRETKAFLEMNRVKLVLRDIVQLYMCVGGVPYYLKDIQQGKSVSQILDNLFFEKNASLKNEFQNLYASLFKNSHLHETIVKALATKNKGLTRTELLKATKLSSGGGFTELLNELTACGFVSQVFPINKKREESLYRLVDEFTLFYFKFLGNSDYTGSNFTNKPSFKSWSGYAFENLCIKHAFQIKKALGIHGILSREHSWVSSDNTAQIDMIIDRDDNVVNLLEAKYYQTEYEMTAPYAELLEKRKRIFMNATKTKKNVFTTMISIYGAKPNEHYLSVVDNQILADDLFV